MLKDGESPLLAGNVGHPDVDGLKDFDAEMRSIGLRVWVRYMRLLRLLRPSKGVGRVGFDKL